MENNYGVDFRKPDEIRKDEAKERLKNVGDYVVAVRVLFDEYYQQSGWGGILGKKEKFPPESRQQIFDKGNEAVKKMSVGRPGSEVKEYVPEDVLRVVATEGRNMPQLVDDYVEGVMELNKQFGADSRKLEKLADAQKRLLGEGKKFIKFPE